jgi:hypothetical protein
VLGACVVDVVAVVVFVLWCRGIYLFLVDKLKTTNIIKTYLGPKRRCRRLDPAVVVCACLCVSERGGGGGVVVKRGGGGG